jgi:hypothetical protein
VVTVTVTVASAMIRGAAVVGVMLWCGVLVIRGAFREVEVLALTIALLLGIVGRDV